MPRAGGLDDMADVPALSRVWVTRPAADAGHWVQKLREGGFNAEALPLIDIAPVAGGEALAALQRARQGLEGYAACMFVSSNAVNHFFGINRAVATDLPALYAINNVANDIPLIVPPGLRCLAPGPGTAAALLTAGVPAAQIDSPPADAVQFDSEALWQVVGQRDWRGGRVLVVRGANGGDSDGPVGRDWLARQWQAAGATVDFVSVYERVVPLLTDTQLQRAAAACTDGSVWLFSSSQAVTNLTRHPQLIGRDWQRARAVATHPRIVETVRAAGWGVVVASRPALNDILATLRSIESSSP